MSKTLSYARSKAVVTATNAMHLGLIMAEKPDTPADLESETANTGKLDARLQCNSTEGGGGTDKDLFKIETEPGLTSDGVPSLTVTVTPIKGNGDPGTVKKLVVTHDQTMDAWQTAAGRARQ